MQAEPISGDKGPMSLNPSPEEMRRIGHLAVDRAVAHLEHLGERRVVTRPLASELVPLVAEPLPRTGKGMDDSIRRYFDDLLPRATFVNHPRFFAYIPGPGSFAGAVGEWLAASDGTREKLTLAANIEHLDATPYLAPFLPGAPIAGDKG